jgi:hypothetical protein
LDNLKTALDADGTLTALTPAVSTFTCWVSPEQSVTDCIMIYAVRGTQINATFQQSAPKQDDEFTVEGEIRLIRTLNPGQSSETVNKAARDRAQTIIDRLIYQTTQRPAAGVQILRSRVASLELDQFPGMVGNTTARIVLVSFTLAVTARTALS